MKLFFFHKCLINFSLIKRNFEDANVNDYHDYDHAGDNGDNTDDGKLCFTVLWNGRCYVTRNIYDVFKEHKEKKQKLERKVTKKEGEERNTRK